MEAHTTGPHRDQGCPTKYRPPTVQTASSGKPLLSFSSVEGEGDTQICLNYPGSWKQGAAQRVKTCAHVCCLWWLDVLGVFCLKVRDLFVIRPTCKIRQVCNQVTALPTVLTSWLGANLGGTKGPSSQRSSASAHASQNGSTPSVAGGPFFGLDGNAAMPEDLSSLNTDEYVSSTSVLDEGESQLPLGLAGLELYEAVMRPADKTATVDVTFDTRTYQWKLSRADSGKFQRSQIDCLRGREEQVLVLCSAELLAGLASDGSSIIVYDQKGQSSKHLTHVHHLSQKQGIPRFQAGELSRLHLSSHDAFKIRNLKAFLLHANADLDPVTAVTAGSYMKTWVVTLSELADIMADHRTYGACRKGFFKLYKRGFARTVYLQLLDGDYAIGSDTVKDAEIMLPSFWMAHHADSVPPLLRINAMRAFSFFCVDGHLLIRPQLHVIHPYATPSRIPPHQQKLEPDDGRWIVNDVGSSQSHQPLHERSANSAPAAQVSSTSGFLGPVSAPDNPTPPFSRDQGQRGVQNPLPYPQPHTREVSLATKKELMRSVYLAACEGPFTAVTKSSEAGCPEVIQPGVSGQHNAEVAGCAERPPASVPAFTAEGRCGTVTATIPPVKQLPLSFYYTYSVGYHPWIEVSHNEYAFWEQIQATEYARKTMEASGLIYDSKVKDWASPPGHHPSVMGNSDAAASGVPGSRDGEETRENCLQDGLAGKPIAEDDEPLFNSSRSKVRSCGQNEHIVMIGCGLADTANGGDVGAESNGLNGGSCVDDIPTAAGIGYPCGLSKNGVMGIPQLMNNVSPPQTPSKKQMTSATDGNGQVVQEMDALRLPLPDATPNEVERLLWPACENMEFSGNED